MLRDFTSVTAGASVTHTGDEYDVDGPVGETAVLESAEKGRYVPGYCAEVGVGIRLGSRAAGGTAEWGVYDGTDGFRLRLADGGLFAEVIRSGTTVSSTERANWNADPLDGTGPSGIDVDGDVEAFLGEANIWHIRWTWYGYGTIEFRIVGRRDESEQQDVFTVHRARVVGQTSVRQPNLPVRVVAKEDAEVFVAGRQYSIIGMAGVSESRLVSDWRTSQSVTSTGNPFVPLLAIRRSTEAFAAGVKVAQHSLSAITNQDVILQMFIGPSGMVTDGAWANPQNTAAGESAVDVNRTATAVDLSSAVALEGEAVTGSKSSTGEGAFGPLERVEIPRDLELVAAARVVGGTDATVTSTLTWTESR